MERNAIGAIVIACILITVMAVLPPALIGGHQEGIAKILYDYQTLITGFAAVGAAYTTVKEMRRADNRSEKRHQDLMELSLYATRLRVNRAVDPHTELLSFYQETVGAFGRILAGKDLDAVNFVRANYRNLGLEAVYLDALLRKPVLRAIDDLLDGTSAHSQERLIDAVEKYTGQLTEFESALQKMRIAAKSVEFEYSDLLPRLTPMFNTVSSIEEHLAIYMAGLRKVEQLYEVPDQKH